METDALKSPPERLEKLVLLLTPPAAREAVMGDLCETYQSPLQYAAEALRTLPFVIASQMRRNLNIPALGLQCFLVFFLSGGFASPARALNVTALALPALAIRGAYQATQRQSSSRAMGETVMVVIVMILFSLSLGFKVHAAHSRIADDVLWLQLSFLAPMMFPALCLFRAGLLVEGDYRKPFPAGEISPDMIEQDYRLFQRRVRRRNRVEAVALLGCALLIAMLRPPLALSHPVIGLGIIAVYVLVAAYLLLEGGVQGLAAKADFLSLRALYQQELMRQQQLRRFLWLLWCAPPLMAVHASLIEGGMAARRPVMLVSGAAGVVLLWFLASALNREYAGRIQEKIGLLERA